MLIPTLYHPLKWVDYSWITIWCSLGLLTNLWPKHPGLKHTESTLNISHTAFSHDINKELEGNPPGKTLQEKIQYYNNTLSSVLDTHAPVKH